MPRLILGTRGSPLALWQARHVASALESSTSDLQVEVRPIRTRADEQAEVPFGHMGGKGFFVKEIEESLLGGHIDLAVHSLKDVPTELAPGLGISAILERHDPRDALVSGEGYRMEDLPAGAVLATGSPRRRCQLLHARSDLKVAPVRGNVNTRLRKLGEGRFDALVLALAGVQRLGIDQVPVRPLPPSVCLPAVGQGALAVETRSGEHEVLRFLAPLEHERTRRAVSAERAFLSRLGGGCLAPATAYARVEGDRLLLEAVVGDPDGRRLLRDRMEGRTGEEERLGARLAERLLEAGGEGILRDSRGAEAGGRSSE